MPSHAIHLYLNRLYFKKTYRKVHRDIDSAYPYLRGKHRIFWHDPISACGIAATDYPGDENAVTSALLHLDTDDACSANPVFHQQLLMLTIEDANRRKRARRQKTKRRKKRNASNSFELEKTEKIFKQLLELQRLNKIMRS